MKIASITNKPRTGDAEVLRVVFSHETGDVTKHLMYGSCEQACGFKPAWGAKLARAMREAERDIALRMFGDDWRKHVASGPLHDYEVKRLMKAVELRPDLFAEAKQ